MTTLGICWIALHVAAIVCYVPLTLSCFKSKKGNRFSDPYAFFVLWASSLVTPFIALAQPNIWPFVGLSAALWWVLMLYDMTLASTITPGNPGLIAYLLPLMSWLLSWPIAMLVNSDNTVLFVVIGVVALGATCFVWWEVVSHREFLRQRREAAAQQGAPEGRPLRGRP